MSVKVENEGKDIVIKFTLKDEYFEVLDDRLEHQTPRRLTLSEKIQVIFELFRHNIENILEDWSWYIIGTEAVDVANDVIAESERPAVLRRSSDH